MFPGWPSYFWATAAATLVLTVFEVVINAKAFWGMFFSGTFWRFLFSALIFNELAVFAFKLAIFKDAGLGEAIFVGMLTSKALLQQMVITLGSFDWNIKELQNNFLAETSEDITRRKAVREERRAYRLARKLADRCAEDTAWLIRHYISCQQGKTPAEGAKAKAEVERLRRTYENDDPSLFRLILANKIVEHDYGMAKSLYWVRVRKDAVVSLHRWTLRSNRLGRRV